MLALLTSLLKFCADRPLAAVLWSGFALLTGTLLVLGRTRWGQARPLSKCIALSVFAHVLFLGFAYGTRWFMTEPVPPPDPVVTIRVLNPDVESPEENQQDAPSVPRPQQPWDQLTADAMPPRPAPKADRADQRLTTAPRRDVEQLAGNHRDALDIPPDDAPIEVPAAAPVKVPELAAAPPSRPAFQATPLDEIAVPKRMEAKVLGPVASKLDRMDMRTTETMRVVDDKLQENISPTISALADLAPVSEAAVRPDSVDRTTQSADSANPTGANNPVTRIITDGSTPNSQTRAPSVRRLGDGKTVPRAYRLRLLPDRLDHVRRLGGSQKTESAVAAALKWLAAHQSTDGRWDVNLLEGGRQNGRATDQNRQGAGADADTGITGLALLAFLGAGHTQLEGPYRATVNKALQFLIKSQADDGNLAGNARFFARMYCHGMATLALGEASAMTGDPLLRSPLQRAASYTLASQHPQTGGWRYQPGDQGDMSQFGWQVMALSSAEHSGIVVPNVSKERMVRFLGSVSTGNHNGWASYRVNQAPSRTMTAEALVCRKLLNANWTRKTADEAGRLIAGELPQVGKPNLYYWYYATMAMYQVQGPQWERWNTALTGQLLQRQRADAALAGSWDPDGVWGAFGGRAYSTAMAALCLQVYYRYQPR